MTAATVPIQIAALHRSETKRLLHAHNLPVTAETEAIVVSGSHWSIDLARTIIDLIATAGPDELTSSRFESVVAALTPPTVMSPGHVSQARLHAARRQQLVEEFGLLGAADIARNVGSHAGNVGATAARWAAKGQIFSVETGGRNLGYPGFQFDPETARPIAVIEAILAIIGDRLNSWGLAFWFVSGVGFLDDRRPVDLLVCDPESVVAYAQSYIEERGW